MGRDLTWKTLSSEYLLKDTWATIRVDTCEKPDGEIVTPYYVYEFPDWVTAVAITKEGNIVLERQFRQALGQVGYETPGGCIDKKDVSVEAALARELLEETGYRFSRFEFLGNISANPSTNANLMHMYIAYDGEKVQDAVLDQGEDLEVLVVSMDEFIELFKNGAFMQSMHVTTIYLALLKLGKLKFV